MRAILAAIASAAALAQTSELLWTQHLQYSVFTSAGIARHASAGPSFTAADWLNQPIEVFSFDVASPNGTTLWQFESSDNQASFQTDMARHSEAFGEGNVDTAVSESSDATSVCSVYGMISFGGKASAVPRWNFSVPQCETYNLDDSDVTVDISDDGSTVAFAAVANETVAGSVVMTPRCYGLDAQTGRLLFTHDLGANAGDGESGVSLSATGAWLVYTFGNSIYVLNGRSGAPRGSPIPMKYALPAVVSDDGTWVVAAGGQSTSAFVWAWSAAKGDYELAHTVTPSGAEAWYATDLAFSENTLLNGTSVVTGDRTLATVAWTDGEALQVRATTINVTSGATVSDWTSVKNAKLQNDATVRMDGDLTVVSQWGDQDDIPTVVVLRAGSDTPVFSAVTPGSMYGVDIVVDAEGHNGTTAYVVASGKAEAANIMGYGGDAFAWRVQVAN